MRKAISILAKAKRLASNLPATLCLALSLVCMAAHADDNALMKEGNAALARKEYSTAFSIFSALAQRGNAIAQYDVGVFYLEGLGVQKDEKLAFFWLERSAAQGNDRALQVIQNAAMKGDGSAKEAYGRLAPSTADSGGAAPLNGKAAKAPDGTDESDAETLRRELAAQKAINQQLMQRADALEKQLAAGSKTEGPLVIGLDPNQPPPVLEPEIAGKTTAIEQALLSKGLVLLPLHSYRLTPGVMWAHAGSGPTRQDSYAARASLEGGLPWGMAAGASIPYIWREYAYGNNRGKGDYSVYLAKKLNNESESLPSFIARVDYTSDTGNDPFTLPSIGGGFPVYGASLSAVKGEEPIVLYGSASYWHSPAKDVVIQYKNNPAIVYQGTLKPGDGYGLDLGASLAVTPIISLDSGFSFSWAYRGQYNLLPGASLSTGRATAGYFNLGMGILLAKDWFLSLNAAAGVTKEATDFMFSVALPYNF